ncbi:MAG: hypothetical protein ABJA98_35535 [Acidobacteriota bacterium]
MRKLFLSVLMLGWMAGCVVQKTTTQPTPTSTLTGTWSGDLPIQGTAARMTWTLTQADSAVSGPVLVLLPTGTVLLNGALAGTLSGSTLTYVIDIGPGAIPSQPSCTGQLGGTATTSLGTTSTMAGSYAINSSTCSTPFSSGAFTLTKS